MFGRILNADFGQVNYTFFISYNDYHNVAETTRLVDQKWVI